MGKCCNSPEGMIMAMGEPCSKEAQNTKAPTGDNWRYRSAGMRCSTCMWFVPKGHDGGFGRCRRHAPTLSGWPAMFALDWCGDHKLDETKIVKRDE